MSTYSRLREGLPVSCVGLSGYENLRHLIALRRSSEVQEGVWTVKEVVAHYLVTRLDNPELGHLVPSASNRNDDE